MFGVVAERPVKLGALLVDAPRSLRGLSPEHPDGWGIASRTADTWQIDKGLACAAACERHGAVARGLETSLAIAHVRKATVGPIGLDNTHPFVRGDVVLAHNGTVRELAALEARTAPEHAAAIRGDTDSERVFAFVLTCIDEAGEIGRGLRAATHVLRDLERSSVTLLVSGGDSLFAYRQGRSLYALARSRGSRVSAAFFASEPVTDEPWLEVPEGALVEARATGAARLDVLEAA
jgi:predicted glutamine amidotransferase